MKKSKLGLSRSPGIPLAFRIFGFSAHTISLNSPVRVESTTKSQLPQRALGKWGVEASPTGRIVFLLLVGWLLKRLSQQRVER
jgi:hypothetical protein